MILSFIKKRCSWIWLFSLFIVALIYRFYGTTHNHPFWVDEFSTVSQANLYIKYGINVLFNPEINFEYNNYTYHLLTAAFFQFFGHSEFVARLPSIIIGSTIPILIYLLGKLVFNKTTAVSAALLTTFSYFEIVWSRQARGYVLLQALILLALYLYLDIYKRRNAGLIQWVLLIVVLLAGIFTHFFFYILLVPLAVHILFTQQDKIKYLLRKKLTYLFLAIIGLLLFNLRLFHVVYALLSTGLFKANNLWYYHSFLWREYGLISFLAVVGISISILKPNKSSLILTAYVIAQLVFLSFFISPYVTRYILPIFPLLILFACYAISQVSPKSRTILPIALILFIIVNGDKFATKPKQFYSVNHDFREIAIIDYNNVYDIIKSKGNLKAQKTAVIDTWLDRMYWYVGDDYPASYMFRWINEPGLINGLTKRTDYIINSEGEKRIPRQKNLRFIGELKDLKMAMKKYPKGFIFIDDSSLPKDVIDYAEKNFKKELYLDHYPLDDNPYSIWPATLYSWGIN